MESYKNAIIELCIEQELLMATIYRKFAGRFPQHTPFWEKLAGDETEHAGWVKHLKELAQQNTVDYDEGKTRSYTLRSFIDYLHSIEKDVAKANINVDRALQLTLDLERSLIERNAYSRFRTNNPKIQEILTILQKGIEDHLREVEAYVLKTKFPDRK